MMTLLCTTRIRTDTGQPADVYVAPEWTRVCGQPAAIVIVTDYYPEVGSVRRDAEPHCSGHAPEAVHEARSCMAEDEFAVLEVNR